MPTSLWSLVLNGKESWTSTEIEMSQRTSYSQDVTTGLNKQSKYSLFWVKTENLLKHTFMTLNIIKTTNTEKITYLDFIHRKKRDLACGPPVLLGSLKQVRPWTFRPLTIWTRGHPPAPSYLDAVINIPGIYMF